MNRTPSDMLTPINPCGILPPIGARRAVFQEVFAAARAAYPQIHGLTCVDAGRAYFQKEGDSTYYSVTITPAEAELLGYLPPPANASAR
jgi:hypothetical protein